MAHKFHILIFICVAIFFTCFQLTCISTQNTIIEQHAPEIYGIDSYMKVNISDKIEAILKADLKSLAIINSSLYPIVPNSRELKYILVWNLPYFRDPLKGLLNGQKTFLNRRCSFTNCFLTSDVHYKDITEFDVVLFHWPDVYRKKDVLPKKRSSRQKYVFASMESSDYYPLCDTRFEGYFNISWTYKLNSDIFYGYVVIRNSKGEIIGPKEEMHWMSINYMKPINKKIQRKLSSKKKLAGWMVSNCKALSSRDIYVKRVEEQLIGTNMEVDTYGKCGKKRCPISKMSNCLRSFERDYYFYFSFENSFAEDYVTEKVLHALQHYTIPVVYGTANYSRFLPEGSYINANELEPGELAAMMLEIVDDKEAYYSYFKWHNHYSFHYLDESPETDVYCKFCEAMNDEDLMNSVTVIDNLNKWWNPSVIRSSRCLPKRKKALPKKQSKNNKKKRI